MGPDLLTGRQRDLDVVTVTLDRHDLGRREQLHAEPLGLGDEPLDELGPADALGEAGVVVDVLRDRGVPAQRTGVEDDGFHSFACGIERRRETRRAPSHDHDVIEPARRLDLELEPSRELTVGWVDDVAAVGEDDRRDRATAVLELLERSDGVGVAIDVDVDEVDPVRLEELLRAPARRAPGRAVDGQLG